MTETVVAGAVGSHGISENTSGDFCMINRNSLFLAKSATCSLSNRTLVILSSRLVGVGIGVLSRLSSLPFSLPLPCPLSESLPVPLALFFGLSIAFGLSSGNRDGCPNISWVPIVAKEQLIINRSSARGDIKAFRLHLRYWHKETWWRKTHTIGLGIQAG